MTDTEKADVTADAVLRAQVTIGGCFSGLYEIGASLHADWLRMRREERDHPLYRRMRLDRCERSIESARKIVAAIEEELNAAAGAIIAERALAKAGAS